MNYLDALKSKFSENAPPGVPTELTKAPSVGFVSASRWHVCEHAQAEDTPTPYWSDVVSARFWVAPTAAQAVALTAQGQTVYQPAEIWHLQDLKARNPQSFAAKLRAIHRVKTLFGATVTPEAEPLPWALAGCGNSH